MQIADYPNFLNIRFGMSLTELAGVLFTFLLTIAGLAAFIMIVWGGVNYLTSAGDPTKTKDAKNQIFAAILGLIILFSSWMILNTINPDLVNIREPTPTPPLVVEKPERAVKPPAEIPAGFYYVNLTQIIDDTVSQEKETILAIRKFAALAAQCGRNYCSGGKCDYWVPEECPAETTPTSPVSPPPAEEPPWWEFWMIKPSTINAQTDCGSSQTCSASCNTGDPCPVDKEEVVDNLLILADKTEEEMAQLQKIRSKIAACVLDEEAILMTCQEVTEAFPEEEIAQNCRQAAYDFYCVYGTGNNTSLERITIPFATVREMINAAQNLDSTIASCSCGNASYACECSGACNGTPCPAGTDTARNDATDAVNKLKVQLQKLEETVAEIGGLSATDEIITLTCSEAYSWLKSIKESGCPGVKVFPCCPVDAETEKTIRNCQFADFFFCSQP